MSSKLTYEQACAKVAAAHGDAVSILYYASGGTGSVESEFKCNICNRQWTTSLNQVMRSRRGCRACNQKSWSTAISDAEIQKRINTAHGNNRIRMLSTTCGTNGKGEFKCATCKKTWTTQPSHVIRGSGCPRCAGCAEFPKKGPLLISRKEAIRRIKAVHGDGLSMIGEYSKAKAYTEFKCNTCDHTWMTYPNNVYSLRSGCPKCARKAHSVCITTPKEEALARINAAHNGKVVMLDTYVSMSTRATFKCNVCQNTWGSNPFKVSDKKSGCVVCFFNSNPGMKRKYVKIKGKKFVLQGHEPLAVKDLVAAGVEVSAIAFGKDVPHIKYKISDKEHRYYPDLMVGNTVIEVKSPYTMLCYEQRFEELKAKRLATIALGHEFKIMMYGRDHDRLKLPKLWYKMAYTKAKPWVAILNYDKRL